MVAFKYITVIIVTLNIIMAIIITGATVIPLREIISQMLSDD